jgi:hypothetical protein
MRSSLERFFWIACAVLLCLLDPCGAQPQAARSASPWNILAYGGKGEMHGAPVCHPLPYFTGPPKRLDIDSDLFAANPAALKHRVTVRRLGTLHHRQIYEVVQLVHGPDVSVNGLKVQDNDLQLRMKLVLVERHGKDYCDIYQIQHMEPVADPPRNVSEAGIVTIHGQRVLKVIDQDNHTGTTQYWVIKRQGPLLLQTGFIDQ